MKSVRFAALSAAVAAVAAASALAPSAASAAGHHFTIHTRDDDPGGTVYIATYGDVVKVCDTDADGRDARVKVAFAGREYRLTAIGNGNCVERGARSGWRWNIPENATVTTTVSLSGSPDFAQTLIW